MKNVYDLLGRILVSLIFIFEAVDSIAYFKQTKLTMTEYGIHWRQDLLLVGAIIFLILGGLLLLTGYRIKLGAFLLLLYWIPVTFIVHSFWNAPQEVQRVQSIYFMKNLGIAGALFLMIANGSGKFSIKRLMIVMRIRKDET
jgi:putative oxidoreductase